MGNHLACISIGQSCDVVAAKHMSNLIFVVHSGESRVLEFSGPTMDVAELMLEFPGFFITELGYSNTHSTNRAVPMTADNELMSFNSKKLGVAYVLLPMNKIQKPVPAQDWATWTQMVIKHIAIPVIKQQSKSRSRRASNRVAPLDAHNAVEDSKISVEQQEEEQSAEEDIIKLVKEELASISSSYSRRHWAPKLEAIIEV